VANAGFDLYAGGLVGYADYTDIKNCYATGFVSADNRSGTNKVYAGGLVGQFNTAEFTAENNFARGAVNAQSAGTGDVYAGGMVGRLNTGSLSNNVALGVSVIAAGTSSYAQRVYAYPASLSGANNRAYSNMQIGTGLYGMSITTNTASGTSASSNGASVEMEHGNASNPGTRVEDFWTGLGFSIENWKYTDISTRRFPRLAWE
jgi:hypothetical protein